MFVRSQPCRRDQAQFPRQRFIANDSPHQVQAGALEFAHALDLGDQHRVPPDLTQTPLANHRAQPWQAFAMVSVRLAEPTTLRCFTLHVVSTYRHIPAEWTSREAKLSLSPRFSRFDSDSAVSLTSRSGPFKKPISSGGITRRGIGG